MLQNADKNNAKNAMLTTSDHENNNPSNSVVMKRDTLAQDIILTGYLQNTFHFTIFFPNLVNYCSHCQNIPYLGKKNWG